MWNLILRKTIDFGNALCSVVEWSPDGSQIAVGVGHVILIIQVDGGADDVVLKGHNLWLKSLSWSPDGSRLVSGSYDNTIRMWDVVRGCEITGAFDNIPCEWRNIIKWSPDGTKIAMGGFCGIRVFGVFEKHVVVVTAQNNVVALDWNYDGSKLVALYTNGDVMTWNADGGGLICSTNIPNVCQLSSTMIAWRRRDGGGDDWIALGTQTDGVHLLDPATLEIVKVLKTEEIPDRVRQVVERSPHWGLDIINRVYSVGWSVDWKKLVVGLCVGDVLLWDVETGGGLVGIDREVVGVRAGPYLHDFDSVHVVGMGVGGRIFAANNKLRIYDDPVVLMEESKRRLGAYILPELANLVVRMI